ncbi:putative 26 proteasome complex subunit sem1 [Triangularia setosa]|uniref:26S proteasome complex subunit SEM1 n=1 Tax=Triangularia setosa TaxID=2587417 RepID=A0AAN6WI16_9PEZI|nr:putative 26 proteasome complex subunit sem1 [Podospora setosa]
MATSKAPSADPKSSSDLPAEQPQQPKQQTLEEDDEFEDFPVDGTPPSPHWQADDTEATQNQQPQHLWEESWDDDDTTDDFSNQLKEELKKVEASKTKR